MMKVGVIAACPFVADRGTPLRILGLCNGLDKLGHKVTVWTYHLGRDPQNENIRVKRIPNIPFYRKKSAGPSLCKPLLDLLLLAKSLKEFRRDNFDFIMGVHFEGAFISTLIKKIKNKEIIFDAHSALVEEIDAFGFIKKDSLLMKPFQFLEKYTPENCNGITTISEDLKDFFGDKGINESKTKVVPNGVYLEHFENNKNIREEFSISQDRKLVVYVGNLSRYQGINYLLESAKQLKKSNENIHFLVVGSPKEKYEKKAAELNIEDIVTFTGQVSFRRVPDFLTSGDFLIAPRIGKSTDTQQASKLMYYLAAGRPIIATDITAHNIIKHKKNGFLINDKSPKAISRALLELIKKESLSEKISKNAKEESKEYSWEESTKKLLNLYKSISKN